VTVPEPPGPGRDHYDAVVVGAGTIGLAAAWRSAQRGMSVAVVDPTPGRGASWVAAGMLAPVSEVHYGEEPLLALALSAARQWPAFATDLAAAAGRPVGYHATGTLIVAADDGDRAWVEELHDFQRQLGLEVQWCTGRAARRLEPALSPAVRGAVWVAADHQVHNRMLVEALFDAATAAGVDVHRHRVDTVERAGGRVTGVRLDDGAVLAAPTVVVAAGSWSASLGGLPVGAVPPVRPVKGQILRLRAAEHAPRLGRTVRGIVGGSSVYLVPRQDGSVVVGATMEERGFDTAVTAGAVYELLRDAHRVVPGVTEMVLDEAVAGLRPGSPDNAPVVGRAAVPGVDGLVLATGHHRQGILLTPPTADAVAAMVTGEEPPAEMAPFGPGRFAPVTAPAGT
jgi:glycine oxidase